MDEMICVSELSYSGCLGAPLKQLSFSVRKGGVHGILSPMGVEASTLLAILAGSLRGAIGSFSICFGEEKLDSVALMRQKHWKYKIGYVPKFPEFYRNMTVYEALDFIGEARGVAAELRLRQIEEALELVGISNKERRLFEKLTAAEKKKASIAAALLGNPSLLLIDEPILSSFPADEKREISSLIRMLGTRKTVLLAGEDLSVMRTLCEDVILLSGGSVLASGSFLELEETLAQTDEKTSLEALYATLVALEKEARWERHSLLSECEGKEGER